MTEQALKNLERLHKTQPTARPWTPVLPYDIATRRNVEGRQPQLIIDTFSPSSILDYGCGNGYLVAFLAELGADVWGYEPNVQPDQVPRYVRHLVTDVRPNPASKRHDLVICREVLEHVPFREYRGVIASLCALSSRFVYITTRFNSSASHILDVATSDDLDPTHITLPSKDFVRLLLVMEGFVCRDDLEAAMDWKGLGRVLVYEREA